MVPTKVAWLQELVSLRACLQRWLRRQAQLLAKAKLSQQQMDMLARVGVVLQVPAHKVEQYAQLQVCTSQACVRGSHTVVVGSFAGPNFVPGAHLLGPVLCL